MYRDQFSTVNEEVYVVVPCSERLPDIQRNYFVKVRYQDDKPECWLTGAVWNMRYWEHPSQYDTHTGLPKPLNVYAWLEKKTVSLPLTVTT